MRTLKQPTTITNLPNELLECILVQLPTLKALKRTNSQLRSVVQAPSLRRQWAQKWFVEHYGGSWLRLLKLSEPERVMWWTRYGNSFENKFAIRSAIESYIDPVLREEGILYSLLLTCAPSGTNSEDFEKEGVQELWQHVYMMACHCDMVDAAAYCLDIFERFFTSHGPSALWDPLLETSLQVAMAGGARRVANLLRRRGYSSQTQKDTQRQAQTWCEDLRDVLDDECLAPIQSRQTHETGQRQTFIRGLLDVFGDLEPEILPPFWKQLLYAGVGDIGIMRLCLAKGNITITSEDGSAIQQAACSLLEAELPANSTTAHLAALATLQHALSSPCLPATLDTLYSSSPTAYSETLIRLMYLLPTSASSLFCYLTKSRISQQDLLTTVLLQVNEPLLQHIIDNGNIEPTALQRALLAASIQTAPTFESARPLRVASIRDGLRLFGKYKVDVIGNGHLAVEYAAGSGNLWMVRWLFEQGMDVNGPSARRALITAETARMANLTGTEIVDYMLQMGTQHDLAAE
ncbi:hypothetical protein DFS34DRAFT_493991 [Phlyctochytrium arcticum]|nr:hypothetical protein DFS34DRAFT_493991 [Phlyctochytrium arcticum]